MYDIPLLGGYDYIMVPNRSPRPNVSTSSGIFNPALPKLLRRSHLDAILVHGYSNLSHWLAYMTAAATGLPYLLRGESIPDREGMRRSKLAVKRALIGTLVRSAAACLAIGEENRKFYRSYGADDGRIFFAPYSVDTDHFREGGAIGRARRTEMIEALGLDPDLPLVLFAAKLLPRKRPLDVVAAMEQLDQRANLVIIGDGPLRTDIDGMASTRPWMRTLGFINQTEIGRWYGAADLFVLPSDHEPWGLAVNEAMAAGAVPVVSDSVGCAADLVEGVGWVHRTGDVTSLAAALGEGFHPGALRSRR